MEQRGGRSAQARAVRLRAGLSNMMPITWRDCRRVAIPAKVIQYTSSSSSRSRVDLLRGTGLAGHLVAGHPGRRPGTAQQISPWLRLLLRRRVFNGIATADNPVIGIMLDSTRRATPTARLGTRPPAVPQHRGLADHSARNVRITRSRASFGLAGHLGRRRRSGGANAGRFGSNNFCATCAR